MKTFHIIVLLTVFAMESPAQKSKTGFDPSYRFVSSGNTVQDKNFYFLTLLENDAILKRQLLSVLSLNEPDAWQDCCNDNACYINRLLWTPEKNKIVLDAMDKCYRNGPGLKQLVTKQMRPSGYFEFYRELNDTALLHVAWRNAADGINRILIAYTTGVGLRYPKIDSATYAVDSKYYRDLLQEIIQQYVLLHGKEQKFFFRSSLDMALSLLTMNNRDEAARFEPLSSLNHTSYAAVKYTYWPEYSYSAILVLGEGPEFEGLPISPYGKLRCNMAAELYKKRQAPFIIVSGGYVHPFQTKFCEAIGMRDYLVNECRIPADRIIIDPHARHTTTNLRNTNRIIFRTGIPTDKRVLCVSSRSHIDYVFNERFSVRCLAEVAHIPYREIVRVNAFQFSYYPVGVSLQMNSADPLDP